jgi:molybdopterin-guanine dinucleotide biosynthesis protein A
VLAGGKGSRLGGINKSLIRIGGVMIIDRIVSILKPLFHEVIIAGWPAGEVIPDGTRQVADNFAGMGPLAGVEAAMKAADTPSLFVFGGDMPWLSADIIIRQAEYFKKESPDVLVPLIGVMTEPLHSVYKCALHPALEAFMKKAENPSVRDFYQLNKVIYFNLPAEEKILRAFSNINTPSDLL